MVFHPQDHTNIQFFLRNYGTKEYIIPESFGRREWSLMFQLVAEPPALRIITRTTRTPAFWGYPAPPHDYPYHWAILDPKSKDDKVKVTNFKNSPKFQFFEFWNGHYTRHTFWSCLIRCANMKWIRWVLLKIQSGHDSVHRQTDGRTDRRTRWYQYTPLSTSLKRGV